MHYKEVELILIIITSVLFFLFLLNLFNIVSFPKIKLNQKINSTENKNVFISVLIPARNEEENIQNCITSVLNQSHENFELIVLNDNSTDRTGELLKSISLMDNRIKIINGKQLESGWVGKNFACHQLQEASKGMYLLFIDTDTVMDKDCLDSAISFAVINKTDLLSIMPFEESYTFWERAVIPMLYFAVMVFVPVVLIEKSKLKQFAVGNGQFMLFERNIYNKIGGHKSLKNKIVEDVWLAKRTKEFGGKLIFADGNEIMKCRMYKNFNEVWNGFSKNFFAGMSFSITILILVIALYMIFFISPLFFLIFGFIISDSFVIALSLISISIPILIRMTHSLKFRQPLIFSFLNILSCVFIILVALNSYRILKFGKGASWKGREYKETDIN